MKIWIDALTPKQALFFNVIRGWLTEKEHKVFSTTRGGYGAFELGSIINYDLMVVGRHGITRYEKLFESAKRIGELSSIVKGGKFDLAISFSSPECARVSFGLGIPHMNFSDSPHAVQASKLTIPLSTILFTPWIIPKRVWVKYGINEYDIIQYKAIDAFVWLKNWNFKDMKKNLGLKNKLTVTIRMPEEYASYLLGSNSIVHDLVGKVVKEYSGRVNIIILSRYQSQFSNLKKEFGENVILLDSVVDGPSLIKSSDVFIGMGGTMSHEAALLGVPTISAYPGKETLIEHFLIKKKLIFRLDNMDKFMEILSRLLLDKNYRLIYRKRSINLWNSMVDPKEKIISNIEKIKKKV